MGKYKYIPPGRREKFAAQFEYELFIKTGSVPENPLEMVDKVYSLGRKEILKIEKRWKCTFGDLLYSTIVDVLVCEGMRFEDALKKAEEEMDELHRLMEEARELYVNSEGEK